MALQKAPRTEFADDLANRLDADLRTVRVRRASTRRSVLGFTVAAGVVIVFAMATAASEVQRFAVTAGFGTAAAWALDPVVGLALIVLVAGSALIADARKAPPLIGSLGEWVCGFATLAMNCWPSWRHGHWDGVVLHAVMPTLLIIFAAGAPRYRRVLAGIIADLAREEEALLHRAAEHQQAQERARAEAERQAREERERAEEEAARKAAEVERHARWVAQTEADHAAEREIRTAEKLAEIARATHAAEVEAEQARAEAAHRAAQVERERRRQERDARKKPSAPTRSQLPDRAEAVRAVAELIRAHEGPEEFVLDWRALAREHGGGGKTWWFGVRKEAAQPLREVS